MATAQDPHDELRVPLENRWQRMFAAAGFIAALAIAALLVATMMPPAKRGVFYLGAAALGACFVYVLACAPRIKSFPDYAITFRPRTMRFPAYPLWRHRHHELVYADITRLDELVDGANVPWLQLSTRHSRFRIPLQLVPPEWTAQRITELITQRKSASQG